MKINIYVVLALLSITKATYSLLSKAGVLRPIRGHTLRMSEDWFSSTLPKDKIQELWRSSGAPRKAFGEKGQGRSLLTVGAKGIGPNTVNSLAELMKQHKTVRVKVASDAIDIRALSEQMIGSDQLVGAVELLAVKNREFMIGRSKGSKK